ncbi:amino acid ABC transporter permease [Polynucleobacter sp. Latsch14-2]|jgi:glutamate/aspartate transport system permease protein|uniref:amino acid ABC transporter permease n=1 Tax=Polynucleobacter sp. Latsch14-2 TaxID=2576920 RepID=UPI001C0AD7B1|nr:amino acid ABC transporter permease [Polynucleobacter sp. Latsch14-2]MBU3614406.1 amino acid ABC transporter permease [Polynucleobacter sp. Latsch14-2]
MALDLGVFCRNTLDGELVDHCFSAVFGFAKNSDPSYLDWLIKAWGWTLAVAGLSLTIALILGAVMGTLRTLPDGGKLNQWLVRLSTAWVELFRNIPILVQVFLWYHVIPAFILPLKQLPSYWLVSIALGFFTSARIAEQVRAGIQSLPSGQFAAATALGLTTAQSYRYVLLPMALRIVIPPLTSESMNLIKNSSVAFAVSVPELTLFAMQAQEETSKGVEIYLAVTLLYAFSAFAVNRIMATIEKRTRIPGFIASHDASLAH